MFIVVVVLIIIPSNFGEQKERELIFGGVTISRWIVVVVVVIRKHE